MGGWGPLVTSWSKRTLDALLDEGPKSAAMQFYLPVRDALEEYDEHCKWAEDSVTGDFCRRLPSMAPDHAETCNSGDSGSGSPPARQASEEVAAIMADEGSEPEASTPSSRDGEGETVSFFKWGTILVRVRGVPVTGRNVTSTCSEWSYLTGTTVSKGLLPESVSPSEDDDADSAGSAAPWAAQLDHVRCQEPRLSHEQMQLIEEYLAATYGEPDHLQLSPHTMWTLIVTAALEQGFATLAEMFPGVVDVGGFNGGEGRWQDVYSRQEPRFTAAQFEDIAERLAEKGVQLAGLPAAWASKHRVDCALHYEIATLESMFPDGPSVGPPTASPLPKPQILSPEELKQPSSPSHLSGEMSPCSICKKMSFASAASNRGPPAAGSTELNAGSGCGQKRAAEQSPALSPKAARGCRQKRNAGRPLKV